MRPVIALAMGDPAGISPELTAKLLARDEVVDKAQIVVIGDRRVLDDGARIAAVKLDLPSASPDADLSKDERPPFSSISIISIQRRSREAPRTPKAVGLRSRITSCVDDGTRRPGRRRLLHAIQQERHAPCASGLRRRDQLFGRRGWASTTRRANSTYWTGCGTHALPRIFRWRRSRRTSPGNASCARCG